MSFSLTSALLIAALAPNIAAQSVPSGNPGGPRQAKGCSLPGLASRVRPPADAELLASYNSRAGLVQSLEVSMMVRGKSGSQFGKRTQDARPAPTMLSFSAPDLLRMTGAIPFSARRSFDFASDGRQFRLLVPDGKRMRFYVGAVDAPAESTNPKENLRPQPIIDALYWTRGTLDPSTRNARNREGASRTIRLNLALGRSKVKAADVEFNTLSGSVTTITHRDAAERVVSEVYYSDWQGQPSGDNATESVCFPRRIVVIEPSQHLELEMKILSLSVNPLIPRSKFELIPPKGIPIVRLGSPERIAP